VWEEAEIKKSQPSSWKIGIHNRLRDFIPNLSREGFAGVSHAAGLLASSFKPTCHAFPSMTFGQWHIAADGVV